MVESLLRHKIKDKDKLSRKAIEKGRDYYDTERDVCRIDGEFYHLFIAKIVNVLNGDSMPVIVVVGDPGAGKTYAISELARLLHEEVNLLQGDASIEKNVHFEPLKFLDKNLECERTFIAKPEANTSFNSKDFNELDNRKNGKAINLSRTFANILCYDAQYLWECDTSVRRKHTIRLVATGGEESYEFDVFRISRENDSMEQDEDKNYLGTWSPSEPPEKFKKNIDDTDEGWKKEELQKDVDEMKNKKKQQELDKKLTI